MIRDPKALAEACAKANTGLYACPPWDAFPTCILEIHKACFRLADALDRERRGTEAATHLVACAGLAMGYLHDLGCTQWALRQALESSRRWALSGDHLVKPLREHAIAASDAWMRDDRRDVLIALELLCVACSDLASRAFGADLDDLVFEALGKQGSETP